jgi:DNA polymerase-1
MHAYIASKIFAYLKDVPLKDIKAKYKKERQIAKSAGFAINYGGSGDTIADNLNISKEEGDQIYKSYFEAFPGIGNYFKKVAKDALAKGYILFNTISNGKYYINNFDKYHQLATKVHNPGFWDAYKEEKNKDSELFRKELKPLVSKYFKIKGDITRKSYNYPVQGSSAEISKLACIYIFEELIKNNYINIVKFSNAIHDEILLECPYALKDVILKIVLDCMNRAGDVYCKLVPLRAEGKICEFWDH